MQWQVFCKHLPQWREKWSFSKLTLRGWFLQVLDWLWEDLKDTADRVYVHWLYWCAQTFELRASDSTMRSCWSHSGRNGLLAADVKFHYSLLECIWDVVLTFSSTHGGLPSAILADQPRLRNMWAIVNRRSVVVSIAMGTFWKLQRWGAPSGFCDERHLLHP